MGSGDIVIARRVRDRLAACAAAAAIGAIGGCVSPATEPADRATGDSQYRAPAADGRLGIAATSLPAEAGPIDRRDADATARAVLRIWFGWNTNRDRGPLDAACRAAPLLSATLTATVTSSAPVTDPGAAWARWSGSHAVAAVDVAASTEPVPPQTDTEAIRVYRVSQYFYDPTGALIDTVYRTVGVLMRRASPEWEVNRVDER
ncbi:hypothetical protein [Nocardia blacklockiae]|uniref:hypothetical protein n=1 Tax=Nocardia blacklockiae TaxID=480036 RepID=UPI00189444B0|nr:hypothetical protein [Nocardia blacklockiae]MBF6171134.1 hypothetical protein [Nocardia blacklockiae]